MKESPLSNFGFVISYLIPGFTVLFGASYLSETIRMWLTSVPDNAPTLGGFLYVTVGSIAAGMTVSTIRWAVVDPIHHRTGIPKPNWNFARLEASVAAFDLLIEIHYQYYQFHANMLVALTFAYFARRFALGFWTLGFGWGDVAFVLLAVLFFAGSRDTLKKYYARSAQLFEPLQHCKQFPPSEPKSANLRHSPLTEQTS